MVIAGQGTVGLELVEQLEDVETVVVPVGGGGLAAGIALGVESRGRVFASPACARRRKASRSPTASRSSSSASCRGPILADRVDSMVEVSSAEIAQAIVLCLERTKLVVEGAGAAGVAAVLAGRVEGNGPGRR